MSSPLAPKHLQSIIDLRRDLHAHPELGFNLPRTANTVAERLRAAGLEVHTGIAETGVVALLDCGGDGPVIGYRADMDALPIHEQTGADYSSTCDGRMHACGHDVHTAIGVGLAEHMARRRDALTGRFAFVFQPNEEGAPGTPSGGDAMVEDGVLDLTQASCMVALHCMPTLDVGHIGYSPRAVWAGSDRFAVTLRGQQSHGAYPHQGVDAILAASHLVTALQHIPSRVVDAQHACVLSVCQFHAGNQFNVLPEAVWLEGILRTLDEDVRTRAVDALRRTVQGVANTYGASAELELHRGAFVTANDPDLIARALPHLRNTLGDTLVELAPQMGAEDFAAFSRRLPGLYVMLGVRNETRGIVHGLHHPSFDVDEACIPFAIQTMASLLQHLA